MCVYIIIYCIDTVCVCMHVCMYIYIYTHTFPALSCGWGDDKRAYRCRRKAALMTYSRWSSTLIGTTRITTYKRKSKLVE